MSRVLKQHAVGSWVRRLRLEQAMSLRSLAARTDFSPSFISQLENGTVSPSIASMEKICNALGVSLGEFFAAAGTGESGVIIKPTQRLQMSSTWSQAQIEALGPMSGFRLEPLLVTLEPGGRSAKHPYPHANEEFAFVLAGKPTLTLGPEDHEMRAGDSVTIRPRELRRWENRTKLPVKILTVSIR